MRQTAKRLLFFISILSLSLWSPNAQARYTDSLEAFFQTPAYQEAILQEVYFNFIESHEFQSIFVLHFLEHKQKLKAFQVTPAISQDLPQGASDKLSRPIPETTFTELFTALQNTNWSSGASPPLRTLMCDSNAVLNLHFKLNDNRLFNLSSRSFSTQSCSPSHWILKLDVDDYKTYDPNIGKAILKIFHQLRPDRA